MSLSDIHSRRPLWAYFVLVFLIAWGSIVVVIGPAGIVGDSTPANWQLLPVFGAMLLGPTIAGIGMTYLTGGREAIRDLWMRQRRWRIELRWYAIALLTTPVLLLGILGPFSMFSPAFVPSIMATDDVVGVLVFGVVIGLFAGFFEEIGWTGFALPFLRRRYSVLVAGLILGIIWGLWHGLADYWGAHTEFGALWLPRIALWTAALTAYRMVMSWVYENTESLLVAQLMHASFSGSQGFLVPTLEPANHFLWYSLFAVALWALVLILALVRRNRRNTSNGVGKATVSDQR